MTNGYKRLVASVLAVVSGVGLAVLAWASFGHDRAWDTEDRVIVGAVFALFGFAVRFLLGASPWPDVGALVRRWFGPGDGPVDGNGKDTEA